MNKHYAENYPPIEESPLAEVIFQTDLATRRKARYRPPLDTIDEGGKNLERSDLFRLALITSNDIAHSTHSSCMFDSDINNQFFDPNAWSSVNEHNIQIFSEGQNFQNRVTAMETNSTEQFNLHSVSSDNINQILQSIKSDISLPNELLENEKYWESEQYRELLSKSAPKDEPTNSELCTELFQDTVTVQEQTDNDDVLPESETILQEMEEITEQKEEDGSSISSSVTFNRSKSTHRKRNSTSSKINVNSLRSSSLSLSSTDSLLLRNKFKFAQDYSPYQHSSKHQELQSQVQQVPIYSRTKSAPKRVDSELIHTVTNTLSDLKTISEQPVVSKQVLNQFDLKFLNANDDDLKTENYIVNESSLPTANYINAAVPNSGINFTTEQNNNKRQFLEELTKSIVDSETYFQKCLTELNKCAAKVVQHKDILQTRSKKEPLPKTEKNLPIVTEIPKLESTKSSSNVSDDVSTHEKVKEIEKTMKDIDENRIPDDKNVKTQYKEDLTSLIEKLKFLASYKKKVNIRPRRRSKLAKEKLETLEKSKKHDDAISNNNFEEVLTQMQLENSGKLSLNRESAEIKNSVQKVVEWKRASNMVNATASHEGIRKKMHAPTLTVHSKSTTKPKTKSNVNDKKPLNSNQDIESGSQKSMKSDRSIKSKVKIETKKNEVTEKKPLLDTMKYRRALEKVIKLTDKNKDILGKNIIDQSTLDFIRSECAKRHNKAYIANQPPIASNQHLANSHLSTGEDDETRLLNEITPASVAPFAAEYSKQKRKPKIERKHHQPDEFKKEIGQKNSNKMETPNLRMKDGGSISMSDVQYLQTLITDPNARYKSTMTIMPVTVKSYKPRPVCRKDIAEKPFESTSSKKKTDMSTVILGAKSPIRAYIMGNRPNTNLNSNLTTRAATTYKSMLQAPDDKSKMRGDFERKKHNSRADSSINDEQPEKLESDQKKYSGQVLNEDSVLKKNAKINHIIDDILTLTESVLTPSNQNSQLKEMPTTDLNIKPEQKNFTDTEQNKEIYSIKININPAKKYTYMLKGGKRMQKVTNELQKLVEKVPGVTKPKLTDVSSSKSSSFKSEKERKLQLHTSESEGHISDRSIPSKKDRKNQQLEKKLINDCLNTDRKYEFKNPTSSSLGVRRIDSLALPKRSFIQMQKEKIKPRLSLNNRNLNSRVETESTEFLKLPGQKTTLPQECKNRPSLQRNYLSNSIPEVNSSTNKNFNLTNQNLLIPGQKTALPQECKNRPSFQRNYLSNFIPEVNSSTNKNYNLTNQNLVKDRNNTEIESSLIDITKLAKENNLSPQGLFANVLDALDKVIDGAYKNEIPKLNIPSTIVEDEINEIPIKQLQFNESYLIPTNEAVASIYEPELYRKSSYEPPSNLDVQEIFQPNLSLTESIENIDSNISSAEETAGIVTHILNTIFKNVFKENTIENIKHLLYEDCSSSTLFRKLDEILSEDSILFHSDSTLSSSVCENTSSERLFQTNIRSKHKHLIFGIKNKYYIAHVLHQPQIEHIANTFEVTQLKLYSEETLFNSSRLNATSHSDPLKLFGFTNEISPSIRNLPVPSLLPETPQSDKNKEQDTKRVKSNLSEVVSKIENLQQITEIAENEIKSDNFDVEKKQCSINENITIEPALGQETILENNQFEFETISPQMLESKIEALEIETAEFLYNLEKDVSFKTKCYTHYTVCECPVINPLEECNKSSVNIWDTANVLLSEPNPEIFQMDTNETSIIDSIPFRNMYPEDEIKSKSSSLSVCFSKTTKNSKTNGDSSTTINLSTESDQSSCDSFVSVQQSVEIVEKNEETMQVSIVEDKNKITTDISVIEENAVAVYKDVSLFVLYSILFMSVFGCLTVQPVCK